MIRPTRYFIDMLLGVNRLGGLREAFRRHTEKCQGGANDSHPNNSSVLPLHPNGVHNKYRYSQKRSPPEKTI